MERTGSDSNSQNRIVHQVNQYILAKFLLHVRELMFTRAGLRWDLKINKNSKNSLFCKSLLFIKIYIFLSYKQTKKKQFKTNF